MAAAKNFQRVARTVKWELDSSHLGFKTYRLDGFVAELTAGENAPAGTDTWEQFEAACVEEGLFFFPKLSETRKDGFARIFRRGTTMASILNVIRPASEGTEGAQALSLFAGTRREAANTPSEGDAKARDFSIAERRTRIPVASTKC